jgi:RNA polymerase sigma-70 factor (ECF subfamily)
VTRDLLTRARRGDGDAFRELVEPYRRELHVHCYRMLGSVPDAEDLLQETLLAAWRGLDRFEERASLRVWLYRIATNRCLNALRARGRHPEEPRMVEPPEPTRLSEPYWLEPYPDVLLDDLRGVELGPEAHYEAGESIALTFVAALQHLPPQQRCVLVLRDALGFSTAETARILDTGEVAVRGALQRARSTLRERLADRPLGEGALPASARARDVVGRFATAVEAGDIDSVVALLADDAWLTMPPEPYEYQGHAAIARFLDDRGRRRGANLVLVPTGANGQPAFGCYLPDPHGGRARAYGLMVLTLRGDRITAITWFGPAVMAPFGLPRTLDREIGEILPTTVQSGTPAVSTPARDEQRRGGNVMETPPIVTAEEWDAAYERLHAQERELTRARDAMAAARRRMPWVEVEKDYEFEGPDGKVRLVDLFGGRRQLVVYRAFIEAGVAGWPEHGCVGCSMVADQVAHPAHLEQRDTSLAFVSRASQDELDRMKAKMGWEHIPWFTITDDFDVDFGVDQWHGTTVFFRDGDRVFKTYFVYGRGDEALGSTWSYLDITPLGRQETWEDSPDGYPQTPPYEWWVYHDEAVAAGDDTPGVRQLRIAQESGNAPGVGS